MLFNPLKKSNKDFTTSDLPSNRFEVIKDVILVDFPLLLKLGLLITIFAIPLLAGIVAKDVLLIGFKTMVDNGEIDQSAYINMYNTTRIAFSGLIGISFPLLGIGFAGAIRVIRQRVWQNSVFLISDFTEGIKLNIKQYLIHGFIIGITYFGLQMLPYTGLNEIWVGVFYVLFYGALFPVSILAMNMVQVYTNSFILNVKNSIFIYFKQIFVLAALSLLVVSGFLTQFITMVTVKYIVLAFYFIVLLPLFLLINIVYTYYCFDKFINKNRFPELYDRGIYRKIK